MIVDAFLYSGEIDLLEIRLIELTGVVDRFVAIVGEEDFRGRRVDHLTSRLWDLCACYPLDLRTYDLATVYGEPFERECLARGIADRIAEGLDPGDRIMHSDVDEIPRASDVAEAAAKDCDVVRLRGDLHMLAADLRATGDDSAVHPFAGPVMARAGIVQGRTLDLRRDPHLPTRSGSGWHLQWVMSPAECVRKIRSFAHPEYDREPWTEEASWAGWRHRRVDPFGRFTLHTVNEESLPRAFLDPAIRNRFAYLREVAHSR